MHTCMHTYNTYMHACSPYLGYIHACTYKDKHTHQKLPAHCSSLSMCVCVYVFMSMVDL